jgi:hypothetical protein
MELKRISYKHKNNKPKYYILNYIRQLIPSSYYQARLKKKLRTSIDFDLVEKRVAYYNKLNTTSKLTDATQLSNLKDVPGGKTYYFDLYEYSRFFNQSLKGHFFFGDIIEVPKEPGFVKSRPINTMNTNAVLLKWNKLRHFMFIETEKRSFLDKKNKLVSRGKVHKTQVHRIAFLEAYFGHPMCNIGKVNTNELNAIWKVNRMTIDEQLEYKFILCLEGNDVASNLKWVMSSKSIAVMSKPRFETWFMEGLLQPDYHYILIKDDYSDLEEKLAFYIKNQDKALCIIENANLYVAQFKNTKQEDLISLCTLKKYFEKTNQVLENM